MRNTMESSRTKRWLRLVILVAVASLLAGGLALESTEGAAASASPAASQPMASSPPADSQPSAASPPSRGKGKSPYSGRILDRVRVISLPLYKEDKFPDLKVAQGERVRLVVTIREGGHSLRIPAYGIDASLVPGRQTVVEFEADKAGTFELQCSCNHAHGVLTVQERHFVMRKLAQYGLLALFVLLMLGIAGIPMPDELMLSFAGGLASTGNYNLDYLPTLLTAFVGASIGISFSYVLGRTIGLGVVHKWGKVLHITPEKLNRVHEWFAHKKGRWALMFCIYMPVFRHLTAIVAGTSKMPFWEFALCAYTGVLMWVGTFITLGYFFAGYWIRMSSRVHTILLIGSLLVGLGVLIWVILKNRREHLQHLRQQAAKTENKQ